MPLKIRSSVLVILLVCIKLTYAQPGIDCLSIDETGLIKKAFNSFENDLFNYYKSTGDSTKTYRKLLAEIASLSINLKKIPSENSIQLARKFKRIADNKNSLWIKLSEYENQEAQEKPYPATPKNDDKEILIFNYRGGFIQCLKNNSDSQDFKDIINTLEEDGNISTSLVSQKIYYIPDKYLCAIEIKNFIAFDIYYSILMVIEKAFK